MQNIKKYLVRSVLTTVLFASGLTACSETEQDELPAGKPEAKKITIRASHNQAEKTRMAYAEEEGIIKTFWTARDAFVVFTDANEKGIMFNNNNDLEKEEENASFSGSININPGDECYAFYPSSSGNYNKTSWVDWTMNVQGQIQSGNGSAAHLGNFDYMTGQFTYTEGINNELIFNREMALLKFVLTLPGTYNIETDGVPLKIMLSSVSDAFCSQKSVVSEQEGGAGEKKSNTVSLLLSGMEEFESPLTAYMMLIPVTLQNEELKLTIECEKSNYTATIPNVSVSYEAGSYYTAEMSAGWSKSERTVAIFDDEIAGISNPNDISFGGGDGETEETAYEIYSAQQLRKLAIGAHADSYRRKYYKLKTDIHITAETWEPIGRRFIGEEFAGYFDGEDHIITGTLNGGDLYNFGFFGGFAGELKNLHNRATVTSTNYGVGGLVGIIRDENSFITESKIENCTNAGAITGQYQVGGIVGSALSNSVISGCTNTGDVTGTEGDTTGAYIGGIIGRDYSATFTLVNRCINEGNITIESVSKGTSLYVGGIAGIVRSVVDCENHGHINTLTDNEYEYVGGIAGTLRKVSGSTNKGNVQGMEKCGGIAGGTERSSTTLTDERSFSFINCVNEGEVSGSTNVGGIAGFTIDSSSVFEIASVTGCTNTGKITATTGQVGGIVGVDRLGYDYTYTITIEGCTNSGEIISSNSVGGIVGSTTIATITQCKNEGEILGQNYIGGIIGYSSNSSSSKLHKNDNSSITIKGTGDYIGTISGYSVANVIYSCNTSVEVRKEDGSIMELVGNSNLTDCDDPTHF